MNGLVKKFFTEVQQKEKSFLLSLMYAEVVMMTLFVSTMEMELERTT